MTVKEKIEKIIKEDPMVKEIYENNEGCFKNIVIDSIIKNCDNDDKAFEFMIFMLATLSNLYDVLLDDISTLGDDKLIKKCNEDINSIILSE
jgi:hypothetical protein